MLTLDQPNYTALEAFNLSISRVRNADLKARLVAATDTVVAESAAYDAAAHSQDLHLIPRTSPVVDVTKEEMEAVYTQRLAGLKGPGRPIYDEIFASAPNGRCPLCGHRNVMTLDHHLPKAHYPALAIAPLNLVPSCSDCNKAKLAGFPATAEEVAIHPYYDDVDGETWLAATVQHTSPSALLFEVQLVATWSPLLMQRMLNHFRSLDLSSLYASQAAEELLNIRHELCGLHAAGGVDFVREELSARATSCRHARRNGWRTAAYRAWSSDDWFCDGGFA
ncbi:hypothetical protein [Agrobacterium sp. B1(2019)]|jgi:hypothetical protein|uniref:HNH endonuclease n=1 Tax=Agrobacterium sp. B1(2019) TaxID=2607032 RepID=UPI0011F05896|nr:hypothetical protein [Agrobacterium sp. B1(2019)]TZG31269.1 hypothetical protein AGR1_29055 [Agrobacterium sp. B1(2019)]